MSRIVLLDQNTINKIAAGEVVERPASIVKELVENAIDAGATAITVDIKEGGMATIRITDNGTGIEPVDIQNAFLRHSTSKIQTIEDLLTVASLGFRGEALASIASVSQVELLTKTYDNLTGIRYIVEGGIEKSFEEIGCPEGTTFLVNNLFFNTPARRKFLKSAMTEASYIADLIDKLALGNPQISFKFVNNGQIKLHTSGNNKLLDCIFTVFNKDIAKNLIELNEEDETLAIKGYIGKPVISRANRTYENYFINGRYIKSKVVQKAIEDAYKSKLTLHQYPFTAFNIYIANEHIDVNVHPTKMDIRFNNEQSVYDSIYKGIHKALNRNELIPEVTYEVKKESPKPAITYNVPEPFEAIRLKELVKEEPSIPFAKTASVMEPKDIDTKTLEMQPTETIDLVTGEIIPISKTIQQVQEVKATAPIMPAVPSMKGEQIDYKKTLFTDSKAIKEHKIVGQLFQTYWIVEFQDKYYIIDQHAAHERVLYDRILLSLKEHQHFSQRLLQPMVVQLTMKEMVRFEAHQGLFNDLGFEIEAFGLDALLIRSVPFIFDKPLLPEDFTGILDKLEEEFKEDKYEHLLDDIASMSCKAAVKAHDHLTIEEYQRLIDELLTLENPFNCPHGRPTIISMTKYELEKKFKRIQ